MQTTATAEI